MGKKFWVFYLINFISSLIAMLVFVFAKSEAALTIAGANAVIMLVLLNDWLNQT